MSAKLDTRQKMINMMYLVFIAMLALQIDKEVLATIGILDNDLESSIVELENSSKSSYSQINSNKESLDYKIAANNLVKIQKLSNDYYNFLQAIKDSLINGDENKYIKEVNVKGEDTVISFVDYQKMDKSQTLDDYFFDRDLINENGQLFISNYKNYSSTFNNILDSITFLENSSEKENKILFNFESVKKDLKNRFKYQDFVINSQGIKQPYLEYNFKGFPVIASIAKFTKIQSDIRYIENKVLNEILQAIKDKGISLDTFQTLLETTKSVYYTGDVIDAAIVMGKKDEGYTPDEVKLFINGIPLSNDEFFIESGKVILKKILTIPGNYKLTGTISKKDANTQELKSIPVDQKILVISEPNSAVVSAENMKVFYRGLRNPTSISIPGVAANSIKPFSSNGKFLKVKEGWSAIPSTNSKITTMKISVIGELNGIERKFDGGEFRILEPPPAEGSIKVNERFYKPTENISKRHLSNGMITGNKPVDFLYNFTINVTSFDIKVGNSPSKKVIGNSPRFNKQAEADIKTQGKGTVIRISNIKANAKDGDFINPNYLVKNFILILE